MHCTQCGQAAAPGDKFCAGCGNPLSRNAASPRTSSTMSRTFKVPVQGLRSVPHVTAQEATNWLQSLNAIRRVRLNLSISYGVVHIVALHCEIQDRSNPYRFGLDVIRLTPSGIRNAIRWAQNPTPHENLDQWSAAHPQAQILTERIVNSYGIPHEVWLLYRVLRTEPS